MKEINPSMSTKEINAALKKYRKIKFKNGTYNLDAPLVLHSKTSIECEGCVGFQRHHEGRMLELYVTPDTTKYKGVHDVEWSGGAFIAKSNKKAANVISLFHGKNIKFENVAILGCQGYHSIEINACRNVKILNCSCEQQTAKKGEEFREAIQIDFANKDGLAIKGATGKSPCYDGTHCSDIAIIGCEITDCPNGIGTHTVSIDDSYHKGIKIKGCVFDIIGGNDIQLFGMKDVDINCGQTILIGKKTKAHKNDGGKVDLAMPRLNKNVVISALAPCVIVE